MLLHALSAVFWNSISALSMLMFEDLCLVAVVGKAG